MASFPNLLTFTNPAAVIEINAKESVVANNNLINNAKRNRIRAFFAVSWS